MTVFGLIDHSGEAEKVGLKMRPTKVMIFGSPKGGTPLMVAAPSLAMVEFLAWALARPRRYAEAREAWASTCPRLSLWEDAIIADLIRIVRLRADAPRSQRLSSPRRGEDIDCCTRG